MEKPALLPERHPEKDFFIADIFDAIPLKNDIHTMEYPFFTLDQKPQKETLRHSKNGVNIKIVPHHDYGLPTINDKDILLYISSLIMAEINKGKIPPRTMRFSAHDLLVTTNRDTNGKNYILLKNAFERLTGCLIVTNIKTTELEMYAGFHILERFVVVRGSKDRNRMAELEVTLSDWLYRALWNKEVLSLNKHYFRLRKPLEKRIYELARKHCGRQEFWEIRLDTLHEKVGSSSTLRKFRYQLKQIIEADKQQDYFPDYIFNFIDDKESLVGFTHKPNSTIKGMPKPESAPSASAFDMDEALSDISIHAQMQVAEMARDAGYNFDYLIEEFKAYMKRKGKPDNVSGAFLNFGKKKTGKRK
jgi:plasmid replication initiation protein